MDQPSGFGAVSSALRALAAGAKKQAPAAAAPAGPVVTISREFGLEAGPLARMLAERLNQAGPADPPWLAYDKELVERVAEDHDLAADLVGQFDEQDRSWIEHFAAGFSGLRSGTDIAMKTAQTIRGIAKLGRAVIVGRGGSVILSGMHHARHVRLIGPIDWRAEQFARREGIDEKAARNRLAEMDEARRRFVRNHFGKDIQDPTLYDVTINMKRVDHDHAIGMIEQLLP
jgi:hypothetical protein